MKIHFDESKIGNSLEMEYNIPKEFKVFRYAYKDNAESAKALFIVQFQLRNMDGKRNIRFSKIPMRALFHFRGFMSKYWLLDEKTNTCIGVYRWATIADAERYSKSIAMKFMKKRSVKDSVSYRIQEILSNSSIASDGRNGGQL
jgi:hypothetical protein